MAGNWPLRPVDPSLKSWGQAPQKAIICDRVPCITTTDTDEETHARLSFYRTGPGYAGHLPAHPGRTAPHHRRRRAGPDPAGWRSEERRVGKEGRSRWWQGQ